MFEFGKKGAPEAPGEAPMQEMKRPEAPAPAEAARSRTAPASSRREAAIIGPSIQIDGDLRGQEDLLIEGEVNGTIQLRNNSLTVGSQGKVKADVYAKEIHVEGLVEGDLYGSERVAVRKSAQVKGNITSPHVSLEEGARFKGAIEMDSTAVESATGTRRVSNASEPSAKTVTPVGGSARSGAAN